MYQVGAMSDEGLRAYIRARRESEGLTQEGFAKAIGLPYPTYRDWESGATQEMKARPFARAIEVLRIPIKHVTRLGQPDVTSDEAQRLAKGADQSFRRDPGLDAILEEEDARKRGHGPERVRARHILEDLIDYPDLWEQWMKFGEYLLTQRP